MTPLSFDDRRAMVFDDWSRGLITRTRAAEKLHEISENEAQARRDVGTGQPPVCTCGGNGVCLTCAIKSIENGTDHAAVAVDAVLAVLPDSPRCVVCGGPFADGSGCEFCPAVNDAA